MGIVYDSREVRRAAAKVKAVINGLQSQAQSKLRETAGLIEGQLEGEAADQLESSLKTLQQGVGRTADALDTVYGELIAYAERLEALDRAASAFIKNT